tara:strand:+ start:212 stop:418 length:207 start_codon:yes stop_codon:yes gene_type:complete
MEEDKNNETNNENELTFNTLLNVKSLIDIAISRGAYKPEELSKVGSIYDRFNYGLNLLKIQSEKNINT